MPLLASASKVRERLFSMLIVCVCVCAWCFKVDGLHQLLQTKNQLKR